MNIVDPADSELTSTLNREAERFTATHGADLSMDRVMARAGEIRRGRRMRASMVMAAVVLAIAVPVGLTVITDDPASTPGPAGPIAIDDSPLTLGDLKVGGNPRTGWLSGGTLRDEGASVPLGKGDPAIYLARLETGFLVGRNDPETGEIEASYYGEDDMPTGSWPMSSGFTVSDDGSVGAFVQPDGTVIAVEADGGWFDLGKLPGEAGSGYAVLGISGQCMKACTVTVASRAELGRTWTVDQDDKVTEVETGLQSPTDLFEGSYAGIIRANEDLTTCSAVTRNGTARWTTCPDGAEFGKRLGTFSPDGEHLLATGSVGDGEGDRELAVVDAATGKVLLDLETGNQAVIRQVMWEDEEHVVALVREGDQFAVLRIGLDGSREYALAPEDGLDADTAPFTLPIG